MQSIYIYTVRKSVSNHNNINTKSQWKIRMITIITFTYIHHISNKLHLIAHVFWSFLQDTPFCATRWYHIAGKYRSSRSFTETSKANEAPNSAKSGKLSATWTSQTSKGIQGNDVASWVKTGENGGFSGFGWENHGTTYTQIAGVSLGVLMVYNRFWICPCQNSHLFDASFLPYALWSSSHVGMEEKKTWIHQPALMHRNSDCNKALVGPVIHLMRQDQPQPHLRVDIGRYHILCKFVYLYWWAYYSNIVYKRYLVSKYSQTCLYTYHISHHIYT